MPTLFETKADKICSFYDKVTADDLIGHMNPEKRDHVVQFVEAYRGSQTASQAVKAYRLKMAPLEEVFQRTHALVGCATQLLLSWSSDAGNRATVEAETGAWNVGDTEEEDAARLPKFVAGFVQFYDAAGLPPGLRQQALQKQLKAHQKAHDNKPKTTPLDIVTTSQAGHRDLSAACDLAFDDYHDFLDGWFGKKGTVAFNKKKQYFYDRRSGYYHSSSTTGSQPNTGDQAPPGGTGSGSTETSTGDKAPAGGTGSGDTEKSPTPPAP